MRQEPKQMALWLTEKIRKTWPSSPGWSNSKGIEICRTATSHGGQLQVLQWETRTTCWRAVHDAKLRWCFKLRRRVDAQLDVKPWPFEIAHTETAVQRRVEKHFRTVHSCRLCVVFVYTLVTCIGSTHFLPDCNFHFSGRKGYDQM